MMKLNTGSTTADNTDSILLNKTPQQQPQTIPRVSHSELAAPWWQGVRRWRSEGCRLLTLVNFFAVTNPQNQDHQSIIFYAGNDSDVTQSVFSEVTKY